ncbi:MAG TPA: CoA transferase [Mycobacterium sp.]|nr:CoA transferase [Mycobacterium sp.]
MSAATSRWAASGLAWLTGQPDGPPDFSRTGILDRAEGVAATLREATGIAVDVPTLLSGRAALLGLRRRGRVSAGGASRLLPTADGWCAITLSRDDDLDAVPALLLSDDQITDPWPAIARWAAARPAAEVAERARLLDLPAAVLGETIPAPALVRATGPTNRVRDLSDLLVADLSSMWAGPLCGRLLAQAGAVVVKVESLRRTDGTRRGHPAFFDWMNSGKLSYAIDFDNGGVRELLTAADVVIEGSRPAALARRGLGPDDVGARPGRVWLRITGHGADPPHANLAAFGDDAAVSGGLVGGTLADPVFCGDAIADPLTGLQAAAEVADSLSRGGGELIEVPMAAVAAGYAAMPTYPPRSRCPALPPRPPPPTIPGPALGADNHQVERIIAERLRAYAKNIRPC